MKKSHFKLNDCYIYLFKHSSYFLVLNRFSLFNPDIHLLGNSTIYWQKLITFKYLTMNKSSKLELKLEMSKSRKCHKSR